jgi:Family of unknown function (DUF5518)
MMDFLNINRFGIDFFEIIWGTILTVILSMILGYFFGALGSFLGFLFVSVCVGYTVNEDMMNGVFYGATVSVLGGILSFITLMVMWVFGVGPGASIMLFGIVGVIFGFIIDLIVGASGGAIGSALRQ